LVIDDDRNTTDALASLLEVEGYGRIYGERM
jgi:hypothetical protein